MYLYLAQQPGCCRGREGDTFIICPLLLRACNIGQWADPMGGGITQKHIHTFIMRLQQEGLHLQMSLVRRWWHHHRESLYQLSSDITRTRKCACDLWIMCHSWAFFYSCDHTLCLSLLIAVRTSLMLYSTSSACRTHLLVSNDKVWNWRW